MSGKGSKIISKICSIFNFAVVSKLCFKKNSLQESYFETINRNGKKIETVKTLTTRTLDLSYQIS